MYRIKLIIGLAALATCISALPRRRGNPKFNSDIHYIFSFGDSYTTECNGNQPHWPSCPASPSGRASSGNVWVDWLGLEVGEAMATQSTSNGVPAAGQPGGAGSGQPAFWNYAVGGATCNNSEFDHSPSPDLISQVKLMKNHFNQSATNVPIPDPAGTIATVWFGHNDGGVAQFLSKNKTMSQYADDYISCLDSQVGDLLDYGIERLALFTTGPFDLVPASPHNAPLKEFITTANAQLPDLAKKFTANGKTVKVYDAHATLTNLLSNWQSHGFRDNTTECPSVQACPWSDYMWANSMHFAPLAQEFLAADVFKWINSAF